MRQLKCFCLGIALLFPAALYAGQIYGSVTSSGKAVARAAFEIRCGQAVTPGTTAADGSYRINVPQQGQCTLTLTGYAGRPSAVVFSYPNPSQFDFELVGPDAGGNYTLRRR
jgi:hypothetical protein